MTAPVTDEIEDRSAQLDAAFDSIDTDDTPSASPTVEATPDETPSAEDRADRGDGRTAKGQFAPKKGDEAKPEEQTPVAADPAKPVEAAKPEPAPFQYRALGQTRAFEGATLDEQGNVTINAQAVPRIRQALNALHLQESGESGPLGVIQQRDATIKEWETKYDDLKAVSQPLDGLISVVDAMFKEQDPEKAAQTFLSLYQGGWDRALVSADASYWRAKASRPTQPTDATQASRSTQQDPQQESGNAWPSTESAKHTLTEYVEAVKTHHEFRGMTPDDWTQYAARYDRSPYAFLRPATSEEAQQYGVTAGQIVFDEAAFMQDVQEFATHSANARQTADAQKKRAAENARKTQPVIDAPPTTSGRQAPPKKDGKITSKQDAEDYWDSDEV